MFNLSLARTHNVVSNRNLFILLLVSVTSTRTMEQTRQIIFGTVKFKVINCTDSTLFSVSVIFDVCRFHTLISVGVVCRRNRGKRISIRFIQSVSFSFVLTSFVAFIRWKIEWNMLISLANEFLLFLPKRNVHFGSLSIHFYLAIFCLLSTFSIFHTRTEPRTSLSVVAVSSIFNSWSQIGFVLEWIVFSVRLFMARHTERETENKRWNFIFNENDAIKNGHSHRFSSWTLAFFLPFLCALLFICLGPSSNSF